MQNQTQYIKYRWQDNPLHGQYSTRAKQVDVDTRHNYQFLCSDGLKAENESFILAEQDQSLLTIPKQIY